MIIQGFGRRELGKTTLLYYLALQSPQRVILDPRNMLRGDHRPVARSASEISARFDQLWSGELQEFRIAPGPVVDLDDCFRRCCLALADWVDEEPPRGIAFFVDEFRFLKKPMIPEFDYLLRSSPRESFHILITAHRPKDLPPDIRAIADDWYMFQTRQVRDLDAIEEESNPETRAAVAALQGREIVHWNVNKLEMRIIRRSDGWKVPLREPLAGVELPQLQEDTLGGFSLNTNKLMF